MLEDVADDDLLRLVRVHPGERVHVDHSIFKSNERKSQGSFQGLNAETQKKIQDSRERNRKSTSNTISPGSDLLLL